jgi:hypothetical protein
MGNAAFKLIQKKGKDKLATKFSSVLEIPSVDIDGNVIEELR